MPAPAPATTSLAYDPLKAAFYGRFVNAAYTMYDNHPSNPTPPTVDLPDKYKFVAWVQMRDFIFEAAIGPSTACWRRIRPTPTTTCSPSAAPAI